MYEEEYLFFYIKDLYLNCFKEFILFIIFVLEGWFKLNLRI